MKRLTVSVLLALCLLAQGCANTPPSPQHAVLPEPVSQTVGGVTVQVDPRIELLSAVQYLSDYDKTHNLITRERFSYKSVDFYGAFSPFKDYEAVRFFNREMKRGFSYDAPPTACLFIEQDFSLSADYEGSDFAKNRMRADMDQFREGLRQFYLDTGFETFWNDHKDFYGRVVDAYVEGFPPGDLVGALEEYYGKSMAGYTITLAPLFHPGGYGPGLERLDGTHIYAFVGPYGVEEDRPVFGGTAEVRELIYHEFGHSFISIFGEDNPVVADCLSRSETLMEPIRKQMEKQAYDSWPNVCEELILRAAVINMLREAGADNVETLLQNEENKGFVYIRTVVDALAEYRKNRDVYPVFDDFVPVIFERLMEEHPD